MLQLTLLKMLKIYQQLMKFPTCWLDGVSGKFSLILNLHLRYLFIYLLAPHSSSNHSAFCSWLKKKGREGENGGKRITRRTETTRQKPMGELWQWKKKKRLTWATEIRERERERSILSLQRALGLEYGRLGLMKLSNMKLLMSICEISRPWAKQAWSQKKRHTHTQAFDLLYFIRFLPAKELVMSLVLAWSFSFVACK